jgi:hypothetical protein
MVRPEIAGGVLTWGNKELPRYGKKLKSTNGAIELRQTSTLRRAAPGITHVNARPIA